MTSLQGRRKPRSFAATGSSGSGTKAPTRPSAQRRRYCFQEPWVAATGAASPSTRRSVISSSTPAAFEGTGHMVKAADGAPMEWRNEGGYQRFIDPDGYP